MMTPEQAYRLFVYIDWAMLLVGLGILGASIFWGISAVLPTNRGRRWRTLRKALICLLVFAMYWATQASVTIAFFSDRWTPLLVVLFVLPAVAFLAGFVTCVVCGIRAILLKSGTTRRHGVLISLTGAALSCVGVAPHAAAMLMPVISAEDHGDHPGTLTRIGDATPDFKLTSVDGAPFHSDDLRGRVVVLNFFATWCGPCQLELPHLQDIWDEFQGKDDFRMLMVGRGESDDVVQAFQRKCGFTFPMASDPDAAVYSHFAARGIPRTYLISRQGTIVYQWTGHYESDISKLRKLIRKELEEKE